MGNVGSSFLELDPFKGPKVGISQSLLLNFDYFKNVSLVIIAILDRWRSLLICVSQKTKQNKTKNAFFCILY